MIRNKINRYRIQYANELAVKAEVDILVTWDCPQVTTYEHIRWVPEDERYIVENAVSYHIFSPSVLTNNFLAFEALQVSELGSHVRSREGGD